MKYFFEFWIEPIWLQGTWGLQGTLTQKQCLCDFSFIHLSPWTFGQHFIKFGYLKMKGFKNSEKDDQTGKENRCFRPKRRFHCNLWHNYYYTVLTYEFVLLICIHGTLAQLNCREIIYMFRWIELRRNEINPIKSNKALLYPAGGPPSYMYLNLRWKRYTFIWRI